MHSCFFFNDTPTTEIYTLSLHDALPISSAPSWRCVMPWPARAWNRRRSTTSTCTADRKSTRLNSSHMSISYAVFCLKKKNFTHDRLPSYPDGHAQALRYKKLQPHLCSVP